MGAHRKSFAASLAVGLLAGLAGFSYPAPPAGAVVTGASSMPAKVSVAATAAASFSVTWRVVRNELNLPSPGVVSSPVLRILIGNAVVATQPKVLSRNLPGEEHDEIAQLREVVQISQSLVYRAIKQGSTLRIERDFADGGPAQTAEVLVTPSGPGSAVLAVDRLSLSFDDESRLRVVTKDSRLRAVAELSTQGVGRLAAQWEIADGATTSGQPVFRPLSLVRQGVAGGGRTLITSPPLPTGIEGTALVRLRVEEPGLGFTTPTLQYYVAPGEAGGGAAAHREVFLSAPRPGEPLTAETRFAWTALAGAEAYQVAFYETPAGPAALPDPARTQDVGARLGASPGEAAPAGEPLAAVFVRADRTEASLQAFALAELQGNRSYLWRVLAIDANGAVVGSSSTQEIFKP